MTVLLTGATGFVGSAIAHELRARGLGVRALVRDPARAARLESWGVELARGDVTDPASLAAAAAGCSHAIHLVAIIKGGPADFERVMEQGTRNVLAASRDAGVSRFVLMSALGVTERSRGLVPYYRAKFRMEADTRDSGLEHVIMRPSFVFGKGGGALATFVRQVRFSPVVTVLGPGTRRLQPIWLDELAGVFARALDEPRAANRTFELGGPSVLTWNDLYRRIARTLGKRRSLVHVPWTVARTGARATGWLPGAPLTLDQVKMLQDADNVVTTTDADEVFGPATVDVDEQLRRAVS